MLAYNSGVSRHCHCVDVCVRTFRKCGRQKSHISLDWHWPTTKSETLQLWGAWNVCVIFFQMKIPKRNFSKRKFCHFAQFDFSDSIMLRFQHTAHKHEQNRTEQSTTTVKAPVIADRHPWNHPLALAYSPTDDSVYCCVSRCRDVHWARSSTLESQNRRKIPLKFNSKQNECSIWRHLRFIDECCVWNQVRNSNQVICYQVTSVTPIPIGIREVAVASVSSLSLSLWFFRCRRNEPSWVSEINM